METPKKGSHRLSPEKIAEIKRLARTHGITKDAIAHDFGISKTTIYFHLNPRNRIKDTMRYYEKNKEKINARMADYQREYVKRPEVRIKKNDYINKRYHAIKADPIKCAEYLARQRKYYHTRMAKLKANKSQ